MNRFEFEEHSKDGLRLSGQGWEPDGAPKASLCLVHGLGEHSGRYTHVADVLTKGGYALIALDLRGHGRSQGLRGHTPSYSALMEDVAVLLNAAKNRFENRPLFLYGHSLGGNLVLNYALRRRPGLAGIISTSPWLRLASQPPAIKAALGRLMSGIWPTFVQPNGIDPAHLSHDPAVAQVYATDPLVHDRISARLFTAVDDAGRWALDHASDFPLPLLLMHGSEDRLTSAEASQQFASKVSANCCFKLWGGLYHEIHNEPQRSGVLAYMTDWLNGSCGSHGKTSSSLH